MQARRIVPGTRAHDVHDEDSRPVFRIDTPSTSRFATGHRVTSIYLSFAATSSSLPFEDNKKGKIVRKTRLQPIVIDPIFPAR
jgi:hypothetical protein